MEDNEVGEEKDVVGNILEKIMPATIDTESKIREMLE